MSDEIKKSAVISPCTSFRYLLSRVWDANIKQTMFIMLNPSTADAEKDDPTIRRCIGYAKAWGTGGVHVVNLFALRATNPAALQLSVDPVGPQNDEFIADLARKLFFKHVVCAWGKDGRYMGRSSRVMRQLKGVVNLSALKINQDGTPSHPLYLSASLKPIPYK